MYIISAGLVGWILLLFTHYMQGSTTPLARLAGVRQALIPDVPGTRGNVFFNLELFQCVNFKCLIMDMSNNPYSWPKTGT